MLSTWRWMGPPGFILKVEEVQDEDDGVWGNQQALRGNMWKWKMCLRFFKGQIFLKRKVSKGMTWGEGEGWKIVRSQRLCKEGKLRQMWANSFRILGETTFWRSRGKWEFQAREKRIEGLPGKLPHCLDRTIGNGSRCTLGYSGHYSLHQGKEIDLL